MHRFLPKLGNHQFCKFLQKGNKRNFHQTPMQGSKYIGLGQLTSTTDLQKNFENCSLLADKASKHGVDLLCFPECFAYLGEPGGAIFKIAEPLDGPLFNRYRSLAKEKGIWISYGGFHETNPQDDKHVFNTHVIVDNQGEIKATYRKLHLFKVDIKDGPSLDETAVVSKGKEVVVVDSPVGKLGITTCYDVRFPELYGILRTMGAQVILVPSAFTLPTGRDHWEVLLRARAIETQCYVAAAAQYGIHNPKRTTFGRSLVADPWGTVISCCPDTSPTLTIAEIDHSRIEKVRESMPVFSHRRNDIYGRNPDGNL